ncbi:hypothetical protein [Aquitalea pelogenes]|uniref:hypothetical protein n=1 Tax=Aquitalea pelogenes TaxID=1293573 RepID=UPI00128F7F66|nr:hypothetical protein [Aquitalea pelogenes]
MPKAKTSNCLPKAKTSNGPPKAKTSKYLPKAKTSKYLPKAKTNNCLPPARLAAKPISQAAPRSLTMRTTVKPEKLSKEKWHD